MKQIIADWFPAHPPIYDIDKTYDENAAKGPFFNDEVPERIFPSKEKWKDFLGYPIASPIGIPAGPLLTSKWIALAANLGFDVLTYKTIRSKVHPSHPLPNILYVDTQGPISKHSPPALHIKKPPQQLDKLAITNSFGMPSKSSEFLREDIPKANASLKPGQVMIVSVVGTPRPDKTFIEDFVDAARLAKESGAKIIEANFSCPNVDKKEGSLYTSPETVFAFASALVKAISPIPLIIKVGVFPEAQQMRDVMVAAARAGVRGFAGINTISMQVVDNAERPALGQSRFTSGICGGPIREAALDFVLQAAKTNKKEKLDLVLIGVGGIMLPEHFDLFLEAGTDVAMTATGMMWDPYIAARYHKRKPL